MQVELFVAMATWLLTRISTAVGNIDNSRGSKLYLEYVSPLPLADFGGTYNTAVA